MTEEGRELIQIKVKLDLLIDVFIKQKSTKFASKGNKHDTKKLKNIVLFFLKINIFF